MSLPPRGVQAVGISWYRRETYAAVLAIMADPENLPLTYDEFVRRAEQTEKKVQRSGIAVIRVYLDLHDFPAFCREKGLKHDSEGRRLYAAMTAHAMIEKKSRGNG